MNQKNMTKMVLIFSILIANLCVSFSLGAEQNTQVNASQATKPELKRSASHFGLSLGSGVFEGMGIQGNYYVNEAVSIEGGLGTLLIANNVFLGSKYYFNPKSKWTWTLSGKLIYLKSTGIVEAVAGAVANAIGAGIGGALISAASLGQVDARQAAQEIANKPIIVERPSTLMLGVAPGIQFMAKNGFTFNFDVGGGLNFNKEGIFSNRFYPHLGLSFAWTF